MKRIGALFCFIVIMVAMLAPSCYADNSANSKGGGAFSIESSTPKDGAKGVSVENLSVKIYFDTEMIPPTKSIRAANAKAFTLRNADGKKIPIKVYYSHKEKGLLMVVSDIIGTKIKIDGNTEYTLTIDKSLKSADGSSLGKTESINFKTLDQSKSTTVYMIMMGVMIVGMIFFTSRSAKKAAEKENDGKSKSETVNPYKEAKKTGKSVEEIVEKDQHKKAKQAEAMAKKRAKQEADEAALEENAEEVSGNKRVSRRHPISESGSQYKVTVVTSKPEHKASTNPKNQSGKQKNSKKKGKK